MCVKKGIAYEAYVVEALQTFPSRRFNLQDAFESFQGGDHNNLEVQDCFTCQTAVLHSWKSLNPNENHLAEQLEIAHLH